jgi:hypothetical protein
MESGVGKPALIFLRHWVVLGYVAKPDATDARSDSRHGGGSPAVTSTRGEAFHAGRPLEGRGKVAQIVAACRKHKATEGIVLIAPALTYAM